ncbi:MAG: hypothetical protein ABIN91_20800 [Mucilaginibacter sp.]|uniref:DUF6896 domain-containing protein n=1 Tax=Mucilaginibacter sp. TaxID=1882438 RepID=UPI00326590A8
METEFTLLDVIKDYQKTADRAVTIFKTKYQVDNILEGWHSRLYEQTGSLKEYGVNFYAFHGIGLAIHFEDKMIDFDFAFFPEPRHDGFDIWRLNGFVSEQPIKYTRYLAKGILEIEFQNLINQGIIAKPNLEDSTTLYFLV